MYIGYILPSMVLFVIRDCQLFLINASSLVLDLFLFINLILMFKNICHQHYVFLLQILLRELLDTCK